MQRQSAPPRRRPRETTCLGDLELPPLEGGGTNASDLAHAGGAGAEFRVRRRDRSKSGNISCSSVRLAKNQNPTVWVTPTTMPKDLVNGDQGRVSQRQQDFRNASSSTFSPGRRLCTYCTLAKVILAWQGLTFDKSPQFRTLHPSAEQTLRPLSTQVQKYTDSGSNTPFSGRWPLGRKDGAQVASRERRWFRFAGGPAAPESKRTGRVCRTGWKHRPGADPC
jgi:hypothetical protein